MRAKHLTNSFSTNSNQNELSTAYALYQGEIDEQNVKQAVTKSGLQAASDPDKSAGRKKT